MAFIGYIPGIFFFLIREDKPSLCKLYTLYNKLTGQLLRGGLIRVLHILCYYTYRYPPAPGADNPFAPLQPTGRLSPNTAANCTVLPDILDKKGKTCQQSLLSALQYYHAVYCITRVQAP